uniref:Uncharacterized protein n=1 Tax=Arundo donax TaxID=35708 RepID=A0A0A9DM70_ARUDO
MMAPAMLSARIPLASIAWISRLNMGRLRNDTSSYHQSIPDAAAASPRGVSPEPMPFQSASLLSRLAFRSGGVAASEAQALDASAVMQRETRWRSSAVGRTPSQVSSALMESFQLASTSERKDSACVMRLPSA